MRQDVLTLEEAADYLHLRRETLLARARRGLVPAARIGREWRFSRRQLLEWLEDIATPEALVEEGLVAVAQERAAAGGAKVPLAEAKRRLGL